MDRGAATPRRLLLVLAGVALAAAGLYRQAIVGPIVWPLQVLTARATLDAVQLLGFPCLRMGATLYYPSGFAYQISFGCVGIVPAAMLSAGIIAYPASARQRLAGIAIGVPALLFANLIRLVHLYVVAVRWPASFEVAHQVVWQVVVILTVCGVWFAWAAWVDRNLAARRPGSPDGAPEPGTQHGVSA